MDGLYEGVLTLTNETISCEASPTRASEVTGVVCAVRKFVTAVNVQCTLINICRREEGKFTHRI